MANLAVLVPIKLHAFVVSEDFPLSKYHIAPLIQPNYAALRTDELLRHDLIEQLDISPLRLQAKYNTRFVDVTTGEVRKDRVGVYLSWTLPRVYRSGITATASAEPDHGVAQMRAGFVSNSDRALRARRVENVQQPQRINDGVQFRNAPDRWVIFRMIQRDAKSPSLSDDKISTEVFVLESDRIRNINDADLGDLNVPDIENLTSAFIDDTIPLEQQQDAFLGLKASLRSYASASDAQRRMPFTIVESGNEYFADYQPHNTSVFSLFDDMGYDSPTPVSDATVTYFVAGFHLDHGDDPLTIPKDIGNSQMPDYKTLFGSCNMTLSKAPTSTGPSATTFLEQKTDSKALTLCHGALRNVSFNRQKSALDVDAPSIKLQDSMSAQAVAVGSNTLDALLAYLRVEYSQAADKNDKIKKALSKLVNIVRRGESLDAQTRAEDEIALNDWMKTKAGDRWVVSNVDVPGSATAQNGKPNGDDLDSLRQLNELQARFSCCNLAKQGLYRDLFACWWNVAESRRTNSQVNIPSAVKDLLNSTLQQLEKLDKLSEGLMKVIDAGKKKLSSLQLQKASLEPFGVHQDPIVLFAGVPSGWPRNFSEPVRVRLSTQMPPVMNGDAFATRLEVAGLQRWDTKLAENFGNASPFVLPALQECLDQSMNQPPSQAPSSEKTSAYIEEENFAGKQGWFPLFMEWEVEYYHIDWKHWVFVQDANDDWCYKINDGINLVALQRSPDVRKLSGRTMITPQASSILKTRLGQLFSRSKEETDNSLLEKTINLGFFSAPLTGIRDHLLTQLGSAHTNPSEGDPISRALGLSAEQVSRACSTSNLLPYGDTVRLDPTYSRLSPFKPVTHGQIRFTKLTIVDKFGQLVNAIEPDAPADSPTANLYPCVSFRLACNPLPNPTSDKRKIPRPITAIQANKAEGLCQFVQIPPRINQASRLNGGFVIPDGKQYRLCSTWENPIWGWVLANYADKSLQVFNANGQFIREVYVQSQETENTSTTMNALSQGPSSDRLDLLLNRLQRNAYARGFFSMLAQASDAIDSNTSEYSGFLPAAFGEPFCLADIGCSIELASPPQRNESRQFPRPPELSLLDYSFSVGLGNADARFDGLVGHFPVKADMNQIYTSFGETSSGSPVIHEQKTLEIKPHYVSSLDEEFAASHNSKLQVRSVIVDPFRPLHLYTGNVFPMKELRLPKWSVDNTMKEMHAMFRTGPLLVPVLPKKSALVHTEAIGVAPVQVPGDGPAQIPLSGLDDWEWMQPRASVDVRTGTTELTVDKLPIATAPTQLDLGKRETHLVEGHVFMRKSFAKAGTTTS